MIERGTGRIINIASLSTFVALFETATYSIFFFQAEDGIRDVAVTGVQTCALPISHYASETERRADRSVAARFDVIAATNEAVAIQDRRAFLAWVTARTTTPPEAYRTIKLANLGLVDVTDADAEILEFGPNVCAIG